MRIDDLDTGRVRPGIAEAQLADISALGIEWDGAPLVQSERLEAYDEAIAALEREGLLYPCFCTRAEIRAAASAPHGELPEGAYPGTCRELSASARAIKERERRPSALRLRADGARVAVEDRLHGRVERIVDDLVIRRGDGAPSYQLATVVDDDHQGVGEVIRGDDLLDSTPRQVFLARLLGLRVPRYAHVPLVLGPDGRRLAKRDGAVTLAERPEGPAAVRDMLARSLGLAAPGESPSPDELVARFDPAALPREPATWGERGLTPV